MQRHILICDSTYLCHMAMSYLSIFRFSHQIDVEHFIIVSEVYAAFIYFDLPMGTDDVLFELSAGISIHSLIE